MNFIVIENDKNIKSKINSLIKMYFYDLNIYYNIYNYNVFSNEVFDEIKRISGIKMYLVDSNTKCVRGKCIADKIREINDQLSIIIYFIEKETDVLKLVQQSMVFDIILKDKDFINKLCYSLDRAYEYINRYKAFSFTFYNEIFRIPYDEIFFIVKNVNSDSVTIYTKDNTFTNYCTIKNIESNLKDDPRFFKTHRSCIINLFKVSYYDKVYNEIVFNNSERVNLVCRSKKKELEIKLKEHSSYDITLYQNK